MAEDWIKMRKQLERHPKVLALASAMSTDRFRIIGGLFAAWSLFDTYTEDGALPAYSAAGLGEVIGWPGFGEALLAVEWLEVLATGLVMPRFDNHNGESSKKRAMDAERKRVSRKSADTADKSGTKPGPDKIRKEKKNQKQSPFAQQAARFDEFWAVYPSRPGTSKSGKKPSRDKWKARGLDEFADVILADVRIRVAKDKQWLDGYCPDPHTYLHQERWNDGFTALSPATPPAGGSSAGLSPKKPETPQSHIDAAETWAARMRELDALPEEEIAAQVARVRAKYGASV